MVKWIAKNRNFLKLFLLILSEKRHVSWFIVVCQSVKNIWVSCIRVFLFAPFAFSTNEIMRYFSITYFIYQKNSFISLWATFAGNLKLKKFPTKKKKGYEWKRRGYGINCGLLITSRKSFSSANEKFTIKTFFSASFYIFKFHLKNIHQTHCLWVFYDQQLLNRTGRYCRTLVMDLQWLFWHQIHFFCPSQLSCRRDIINRCPKAFN